MSPAKVRIDIISASGVSAGQADTPDVLSSARRFPRDSPLVINPRRRDGRRAAASDKLFVLLSDNQEVFNRVISHTRH